MNGTVLEELKALVGFDQQDAQNLQALAPVVRPATVEIVERLYQEIRRRHPAVRDLLTTDHARAERMRQALYLWINGLFAGSYDAQYAERRAAIGHAHLRVGLDLHVAFAAIEIIRQELVKVVRQSKLPHPEDTLASLHKLLAIDTGLIGESYKKGYAARARETERSRVRDQLTRAEHLAQIGSLAASIAHEVKNPLAGISGAIQVIQKGLDPKDPRRPVIAEVLSQIDRLDSAVKDLLLYARPNPPRMRRCDLDAIIKSVLHILRAEPDMAPVRVDYHSEPDLPPLHADQAQIEQVLINLLLNAAQASQQGDTIDLSVAANHASLKLVLRDQGCGMDELVHQRIYEPFFTTKAKGTGLGLSICRRIVEAHNGTIAIDTELGRGTTVTVELPVETHQ